MRPVSSPPSRPTAPLAARPTRTYELWREADGTYAFFPRDTGAARGGDAGELVWTVEAASWEEAVAAQRRYLGWGG